MERTLQIVLVLCFLALCLATSIRNSEPGAKLKMKRGAKRVADDADAKVEVVHEGKDESAKEKKIAIEHEEKKEDGEESDNKNDEHDDIDDDDEEGDHEDDEHEEEEEEEEEDPNAKIEVNELYTPKDCVNKSKSGDLVVIHYKGWLDDGTLFDTTIDAAKGYVPFEFMLGTGTVIKGFERGVLGMCKGMKREIVIPPSLGYGKKGAGQIPGKICFC